jgi:hypothetical protein
MMAVRYANPKQINRHRRELRILRTAWAVMIHDIGREALVF